MRVQISSQLQGSALGSKDRTLQDSNCTNLRRQVLDAFEHAEKNVLETDVDHTAAMETQYYSTCALSAPRHKSFLTCMWRGVRHKRK